MKRIAAGALLASAFAVAPAQAAPVAYVRACDANGAAWFYVPGTTDCANAYQITQNQFDATRLFSRALTGVAMSNALVTPFVPDGLTYAVSAHWGAYENKNAFGLGAAWRVAGAVSLFAGVSFGLDQGSVALSMVNADGGVPVRSWNRIDTLGKVGVSFSW